MATSTPYPGPPGEDAVAVVAGPPPQFPAHRLEATVRGQSRRRILTAVMDQELALQPQGQVPPKTTANMQFGCWAVFLYAFLSSISTTKLGQLEFALTGCRRMDFGWHRPQYLMLKNGVEGLGTRCLARRARANRPNRLGGPPLGHEVGHARQVVGSRHQVASQPRAWCHAPITSVPLAAHRLHPTKDLLHSPAEAEAHRVAGMTGRATVDGRVLFLCDIRHHPPRAHVPHTIPDAVAAVTSQRARAAAPFLDSVQEFRHHIPFCSASGRADRKVHERVAEIFIRERQPVLETEIPAWAVTSIKVPPTLKCSPDSSPSPSAAYTTPSNRDRPTPCAFNKVQEPAAEQTVLKLPQKTYALPTEYKAIIKKASNSCTDGMETCPTGIHAIGGRQVLCQSRIGCLLDSPKQMIQGDPFPGSTMVSMLRRESDRPYIGSTPIVK